MRSLEDYREIVGDKVILEISERTRKLQGKRVIHVNSTYQGGGVAQILNSLVPLMNDVGIEADWRILHGTTDFFTITKKFHNALQGAPIRLSDIKKQLYVQTSEEFSRHCYLDADCVIVHDPQPLPMIKFYKKHQPWIWRCHIDLTDPNMHLWEYLESFVVRYDMVIISNREYAKEDLPIEQRIVYPAIDPLSLKNTEISDFLMWKYITKAGIPTDKPVITQVSRMDPWKDPEGLLEVFGRVREKVDCRLIYCYDMATDDPEGAEVYYRVRRKAKKLFGKGDVIFILGNNQVLVNAIQRFSNVILQKSIREGFCLAVTEALWKGTPVVSTKVGGIPIQIQDGVNGFLVDPHDSEAFADRVVHLLQNPSLAAELGSKGRETVKEKFLITRLLLDYSDMLSDVITHGHENTAPHLADAVSS